MAEKKITYPMLPLTHWWRLREKFMQSIPGTVTANYLSSVLNMKERSARVNVLPYLRQIGIIDEDGKVLNRAREWRDDVQYPELCATIAKELYPTELLEAVTDPADRKSAERWFRNSTGAGNTAVERMTRFFSLLLEANPETKPQSRKAEAKKRPSNVRSKKRGSNEASSVQMHEESEKLGEENAPSVYINLQIHVSSDATPDQIDKIFESMTTHIYQRS